MIPWGDALIAYRNIGRNRLRTILTLLAVAFATSVLVFGVSLQLSSYDTSINASTRLLSGHLQIQREGYLKKPQIRSVLQNASDLQSQVAQSDLVTQSSLRAMSFGLVSSKERSYGVQIFGMQADREGKISSIPGVIREGRYLRDADVAEAIIGRYLARNLRIGIGDELTFLAQGRDGSLAAGVVEVVGIYESGTNELDRSSIQLPLAYFQNAFSMPGEAHALVVLLDSLSHLDRGERALEQIVRNESQAKSEVPLDVLRWDELLPGLKQSIELDYTSGWLFFLSLVLVVTFTILNTFLMSVLERTREFGVLLALGMRPERISLMIILECAVLTVFGICAGMLLGSLVVTYFGAYGFRVPGAEELQKQWNLPAVIYPEVSLQSALRGPLIILTTGILASLYPALRVFYLIPREAIHGRS